MRIRVIILLLAFMGVLTANQLAAQSVQYTDTALMLSKYLRKSDTATMLVPYLRKTDTANLVSKYLRKSDTTFMLSPYLRKSDTANLVNKYLRKSDTTFMLSPYLRKSDTANLVSKYLRKSDTTFMLSPYLRKSDSAFMLSPYLRKSDTAGMLKNYVNIASLPAAIAANMVVPSLNDVLTKGNISTLSATLGSLKTTSSTLLLNNGADTAATLSYVRLFGTDKLTGNGVSGYLSRWNTSQTLTNSALFEAGGNLGIGTTAPGTKLDINGNFRVSGIGANATPNSYGTNPNYIRFLSTGSDFYIGTESSVASSFFPGSKAYDHVFYGSNPINMIVGGVSRLYVNGAGDIGIGTSNPVSKFDIEKASQSPGNTIPAGALLLSNRSAGNGVLELGTNASATGWIQSRNSISATFYPLALQPTGGNLIVGNTTDNGTDKLQVNGSSNIGGTLSITGNTSIPATAGGSSLYFAGGFGTPVAGRVMIGDGTGWKMHFSKRLNAVTTDLVTIQDNGDVNITGNATANRFIKTGGTASQYLMADGSTSTLPSFMGGAGTLNYVPKLTASNTIGNSQIFDNGTNVGIGTTNPGSIFELYQATPIQTFNATSNSAFHGLEWKNGGSLDAFIKQLPNSGEMRFSNGRSNAWGGHMTFYTDLSERMRISPSGNVGIGTSYPLYKLQVYNSSNGSTAAFGNSAFGLRIDNGGTFSSGRTTIFGVDNSFYGSYQPLSIEASTLALQALTGGNVGIGNTNAIRKLTVSGTAGDAMIALENIGIDYYGIGMPNASGDLAFYASAANERMRLTSSGNLGLGTTSPNAKFHIHNPNTSATTILAGNNNGGTYFGWDSDNRGLISTYISSDIKFGTSYSTSFNERMRMTSGGNLLIGTTNDNGPDKLQVSGSSNIGGTLSITGNTSIPATAGGSNLYFAGGFGSPVAGRVLIGDGTGWKMHFSKRLNSVTTDLVTVQDNGDINITGNATANRFIKAGGTSSQYLMADGSTSTLPNFMGGSGTFNYIPKLTGTNSIGNSQIFDNGTNVGIGTASPSSPLEVSGSGGTIITTNSTNATGYSSLLINSSGILKGFFGFGTYLVTGGGLGIRTASGVPLSFSIGSATESMFINTSGNVGIGTTSPAAKLEVNGTGIFSSDGLTGTGDIVIGRDLTYSTPYMTVGFGGRGNANNKIFAARDNTDGLFLNAATGRGIAMVVNGGSTTAMNITSAGNVGIGSTSPLQKFSVFGGNLLVNNGTSPDANSGIRIVAPISTTHYNWMIAAQQNANGVFEITPSTAVGGTAFTNPALAISSGGRTMIGTTTDNGIDKLQVAGSANIIATDNTGARQNPLNTLTLTGENPNAPYNGFGASLLFNNRAYTSGIVNSARIRSQINNNSIANNGGSLVFEVTPNAGASLTPALTLDYNGSAKFSSSIKSTSHLDNDARRILSPEGGTYITSSSSVSGAIKIKLPAAQNNSSTMMMFRVKVYQYSTGMSHEFQIGGYNYNLGNWYNVFATNLTDNGSNFTIRFGYDGTSDCVWIGETNSSWVYPQVFVTDFQSGYAGISDEWAKGWNVSFVSGFDNVEQVRLAAQVITSNNIGSYAANANGTANYIPKFISNTSIGNSSIYEADGNVGIGTTSPGSYKLAVEGTIGARKMKITQQGIPWADYVFHDNYQLRSLESLDEFIQQNKHLPEVPTTKEVNENGLDIADTQTLLLKKIEELTLYMIELKKENIKITKELEMVKKSFKKK